MLRLLSGDNRPDKAVLPEVERRTVAHLMFECERFPHVDWAMAATWIARQSVGTERARDLRRAIVAVWLDEIRDAMVVNHRRWRHARIEGLGPLKDRTAIVAAKAADHSIKVIEKSLRPILGSTPMEPVAVIVLATIEDYISFISPFYGEEGAFATSGGVYIPSVNESFPFIVLSAPRPQSVGVTLAHELTHHALVGLQLPLWVEEGLTQMMEERATGVHTFVLNRELVERHRDRWARAGLASFWDGSAFGSPHEDEQELAYHLAQILVRGQLDRDAEAFFRFTRACNAIGPDAAMRAHFGSSPDEAVHRFFELSLNQ